MPIPIAALIAMTGQGLQAFGESQEAQIAAGNMEYQAYIAEQDARLIEEAGELEQGKLRTQKRRMLSRAVAIAAASGRDISGGSPLAALEASERAFVLDEQIMALNKHIAIGRKRSEAALLFGTSKALRKAAKMGVWTSLLGIGASATKSFTPAKKATTISKDK